MESPINDLLPLAEYLTADHPRLTSLHQLDRASIEGFLACNRTRGWRGQRATAVAGRSISAAVAQSAVLSLRNLLDDITAWGWAQAPPRRLIFADDIPKLDQPLPRSLTPDVDAAVMNAVASQPGRPVRQNWVDQIATRLGPHVDVSGFGGRELFAQQSRQTAKWCQCWRGHWDLIRCPP